MSVPRLTTVLHQELEDLRASGRAKGKELIIESIKRPSGERGPRYMLKGYTQEFIKMNSNSYLGMSLRDDLIAAEEKAVHAFGTSPGACRFISGTHAPHRDLEKQLARFHDCEDAILFSSAYATMIGTIVSLVSENTIIISDALNHNCIINAIKLSRPKDKKVYKHNDLTEMEAQIRASVGQCGRIVLITDGIFSMRGDNADLPAMKEIISRYDDKFPQNIVLLVDDSHGVGAYGATGRGTVEYTGAGRVDVLIGTLGKAFGANGGYVAADETIITYLREKAITYIYSNPITVGEAAVVQKVLEVVNTPAGAERLKHLGDMTRRFRDGIVSMNYETMPGAHPIVPLMVRDTAKTSSLVMFLRAHGVLATGLNFPVVPDGDQSIRFQVNADHTALDIDTVLGVLKAYLDQA